MDIGIGLNEEYNFTLLLDFDFVEFSGADVAFRVEVEALPLALAVFEVTGLTMVSCIWLAHVPSAEDDRLDPTF
jgi:hypothetical protein